MRKIIEILSVEVSHPRAVLLIVMLTMLLVGMAVGRGLSSLPKEGCVLKQTNEQRGDCHVVDINHE
jgi:hypothetical protein